MRSEHRPARRDRHAGTGGDAAQTYHLFVEAADMSPGELEAGQ